MDNILDYEAFIHTVRMLPDSHALFLIDFFAIFEMVPRWFFFRGEAASTFFQKLVAR